MPSRPSTPSRRPRGFTLIETVVVLLIFGIVIAMAAAITRGVAAGQKRSLTATRMAGVDAALVNYVAQQRRLPCPADGGLPSTDTNAGVENVSGGTCASNQQRGVVPWRTLGLSETDATDGWLRRLTYRTDPQLTLPNGMDMSACDPAGGAAVPVMGPCVAPCTATGIATCTPPSVFLNGKGVRVKNVAGTILMDPVVLPYTGAAYVLISHGESAGGGYLNSGELGTSSIGDGNEELKNYASLVFTSQAVTYYVDDSISDVPGATHFDDVVSRPSVMTVVTKAGLGPRPH